MLCTGRLFIGRLRECRGKILHRTIILILFITFIPFMMQLYITRSTFSLNDLLYEDDISFIKNKISLNEDNRMYHLHTFQPEKITQSPITENILSSKVLSNDRIYHPRNGPIVIEEYKLIFFTIPKVACSEWKRMFMRMTSNAKWCLIHGLNAHNPDEHELKYLAEYPIDIATTIMTSPEWTRAVFIREPKERILSAFLDKAMKEDYFVRKCCDLIPNKTEVVKCRRCRNPNRNFTGSGLRHKCIYSPKNFENFLYYITNYPETCFDVHWEAQAMKIDAKWWPFINFIGYQSNLQKDSRRLLELLYSSTDSIANRSAWERYGESGWGTDVGCENRTASFMEENTSTHKLDTGRQLIEWYSRTSEEIVEKYWSQDWSLEGVHFPELKLFIDKNENKEVKPHKYDDEILPQ